METKKAGKLDKKRHLAKQDRDSYSNMDHSTDKECFENLRNQSKIIFDGHKISLDLMDLPCHEQEDLVSLHTIKHSVFHHPYNI